MKRKEERRAEGILEQIIADNFPILGKEAGIQVQEAQRAPSKSIKIGQHPDI